MTTAQRIDSVLERILDKLVKDYAPEKVILFGSYAYGTPGPDSDIDLLVIKETSDRIIDRCFDVRSILTDTHRHIPLDVMVLTSKELNVQLKRGNQFVEEIIERGRVLYAT